MNGENNFSLTKMKNNIYLYIISILLILFAPFFALAKEKDKAFTVVIDAGHGGKDIGATDNGAREKDINLGVALELEKILKKKLKGAKIVMTRDDDTYLTLQQRADVANKAKGDLFISIHTNSVDKKNKNRKTVAGSSVYALGLHKDDNNMQVARRENSVIELESNFEQKYSGFDPAKDESYIIFEMAQKKNLSRSLRFAEDVEKELVASGRKNRGVHQAGFWVLWATSMPAVLVELDFICNPNSAAYMTSAKGRKSLAEAIGNAVVKYRNALEKQASATADGRQVEWVETETNDVIAVAAEEKGDGTAAKLNSSQRKAKVDRPSSQVSNSQYSAARRRRRSESSRTSSGQRNVETASIPLHTESERSVSLISMAEESTPSLIEQKSEPEKSDKKSKKKEKKRKEKAKKENKRKENAHNAKVEKFVTVYKIQILASADLLKQNDSRFCGLTPISTYKENNLYKYYYGESTDKNEIDRMLKEVKEKIPDAYVVAAKKSVDSAKN